MARTHPADSPSRSRAARRVLALCLGAGTLAFGARAGADAPEEEWFGSPITGAVWRVEHDRAAGTKRLLAQDGRTCATIAEVVETEARGLPPLELRIAADLLAMAADAERRDELVDVTCILRSQPLHDAGVAARARVRPLIDAQRARQQRILDRIAPLRTFPGGRAPDVATAMAEEARLLTEEEKATLREVRDEIRRLQTEMRSEVMTRAAAEARDRQAALAEWIAALPGALDFGGTVVLNARSARVPAGALPELAARFPDVIRVQRIGFAEGCLDAAVPSVGAGSWWNASYNGSSSTVVGVLDSGIDSGHPALQGVVANSAVYHTTASTTGTQYGDNSSSTDDLQGHGTTVGGMIASTDSTYRGIAYGAQLLNAKAGFLNATTGSANMYFSDGRLAGDWAITNGATALMINFGGAGTNDGTDEMSLFLDAAAFSLDVASACSARNDGSSSSTVGYPGGAFNALTCGNFDDNGTTTHSDDSLYTTSGRGPTSDGRRKPDLCGPGVGIASCTYDWETNADFASFTPGTSSGTSTVGPIVIGAVALLQDYGAATIPAGHKALLLTTADQASPYGGPDNDWGCGALDVGAAYTYRNSVAESELTSSGARYALLRGGSLGANGRATLVWQRQVTANGSNIPTTYYAIQDLDLYVYDEASGNQLASSTSTANNVEQVQVSSSVSTPVYKVLLNQTFTSSYSTEPFAVAAESTSSTSVVTPPALALSFSAFTDAVPASTTTTVSVQVQNTGGAAVFAPSVTLTVPSSWTLVTGSNPQTLADVAGGSSRTATWTVRSPAGPSGTGTFGAAASSTSYGETITATSITRGQTVDVDPPTGSVSIAAGASYTTGRNVSVALSATDAHTSVTHARVRFSGDAWGAWTAYATSLDTTLPAGDGTKTFEAEFRDAVGNVSSTVTDTIVLDATAPTVAVSVAGGVDYVNAASVTVTLDGRDATSGVAEMRFSNDQVGWSGWSAYAATPAWTLAPGEGTRTVYVEVRDAAGNTSPTGSDSIVVETGAPSGTVSVNGDASWTTSRDVTLALSATDAVSGVADVRLSENGTTWSAWQAYAASLPWTLAATDGPKTVYAQFRDRAGNVSQIVSDGITLDTRGPTGVVSVADGSDYTTTGSVSLAVDAYDLWSGVSEMRFSNDDATWSAWTTFATTASWTLASGDGAKTVYVQFKDGVGNVSQSYSDGVTLDTTPPTGATTILGDRGAINTTSVTLDLTWFDADSGVAEVRASNDGQTWSSWSAARQTLSWTIEGGDGPHTVYVQYRDRAGNLSQAASDVIVLDTVAPTGSFALLAGAGHLLPWQTLTATTTTDDGAGGSGVPEFRTSVDGGATWSYWVPIGEGGVASIVSLIPSRDAVLEVMGQFRDGAGNVSAVSSDTTFVLDDAPPSGAKVSTLTGTLGLSGDRDAVFLGLVAGDKLTLKLKTKPLVKKAAVKVEVDLYGPDGSRLVEGAFPASSKKGGITKFTAPATGEYLVVLRATGDAADTGITYAVTITSAPGKGTRGKKGVAAIDGGSGSGSVSFDASEGLVLGGSLTGPLTGTPTLLAPDGTVTDLALVPGRKGAQNLVALELTGGSGTYVLTLPASAEVKYQLTLANPKRAKADETALAPVE